MKMLLLLLLMIVAIQTGLITFSFSPVFLLIALIILTSCCKTVSELLVVLIAITSVFFFIDSAMNSNSENSAVTFFMRLNTNVFLVAYTVTGFLLLLVARNLSENRLKLLPKPTVPAENVRLSTEQLAYFAGGYERVIDCAMVSLIEQGYVKLSNDKQSLQLTHPCQPQSTIEQAIVKAIKNGRHNITELLTVVKPRDVSSIHDSLISQKLWSTDSKSSIRHIIGMLLTPLILLGLARFHHDASGNTDVNVLFALLCLTVFTPLFFGRGRRTSYGCQVLECHKRANETQPSLHTSLAIIGLSVLTNTADIGQALTNSHIRPCN